MPMTDPVLAALAAFAAAGLPRLLFVTHAWGGGVEQHVGTLVSILTNHARVLVLRPIGTSGFTIELPNSGRLRLATTDWQSFVSALRALQFVRVHIHHIHGFPKNILGIDLDLAVPLDWTLHDYACLCPQYQLVDPTGRYCGEPDNAGCNRCIEKRPHAWQMDIVNWRETCSHTLVRAARVFAPSLSVMQKVKCYIPEIATTYLPHPEPFNQTANVVKVALLGALSNAKGLAVALAVAEYAKKNMSLIVLRLIGHAAEPLPSELTATGTYDADELSKLIAIERPDVIWLPSQVPETFSFTLSAALDSGVPVVGSDIGALAERLCEVTTAILLPHDSTPAQWHDALLVASKDSPYVSHSFSAKTSAARAKLLPDDYLQRYVNPLPRAVTAASVQPMAKLLEASESKVAGEETGNRPLLNVFRVGVYGGHQPSTKAIELALEGIPPGETHIVGRMQYEAIDHELSRVQRIAATQQEQFADVLASIRDESAERQAALDRADERAQAARDYIAHLETQVYQQNAENRKIEALRSEMVTSTSWRITRPLRGAVRIVVRTKHLAQSGLKLVPRMPVLLRGGIARFRRGGWRSVGERLATEFRSPELATALALPETGASPISPLTIHTNSTEPLVSILIPVYGEHETTFACLKSIADHPTRRPFEVIVMDDCSPEPASDALKLVSGIRIMRNTSNGGFILNVNAAAAQARGQWLIILNNDTVIRAGALDALLDTFNEHQSVGLVGAKLLNSDGSLQEAGAIIWRDGSAWNWGRGQRRDDPRFNFVRDADFCSGAALAISRQLFAELGGFDVHYSPAYYEDVDLAFRIRARGLRVLYQPAAEVFHIEGVSHGRDESSGIKFFQALNAKKFFARWQSTLLTHRENGVEPQLEAHRTARSNILIVEACMITPDQDAGSVRMLNLLRILRDEGHHVIFVADNLDGNAKYATMLTKLGVEVLYGEFAGSVRKVLRERGPSLATIVFCRYYIAAQYVSSVRSLAPHAQIIFDTVDLHFVREEREAALLGNAAMIRSAALTRTRELSVIERSDVTIVVSDVEKRLLSRITPLARIDIISTINEPVEHEAHFTGRSGVLFVGGFRHPPNLDAIKWYVSEVLPRLRKLLPTIVTTIVGSNMPPEISALRCDGLLVKGFVSDIAPLLNNSRVSIAPLRYGAGIKGKINEAMNHGVPVVATTCAIEGMRLSDGRDVLVADDAEAFAQAIARLHQDQALWELLSFGGRANVRAHFSTEAARTAIRSTFTS